MSIKDTDDYKKKMKKFRVQDIFRYVTCPLAVLAGIPLFIIGGIDSLKEEGMPFPLGIIFIIVGVVLCIYAVVFWIVISAIQKPYLDKVLAEESAALQKERELNEEKEKKEKTAAANRKIKNYISKRNLVLMANEKLGFYVIKVYTTQNGTGIGCVVVLNSDLEVDILEHDFSIKPLLSLTKSTHYESKEIPVQTHSIYDNRGNYTAVYGTKDIGHDVEDFSTVLYTTNSKGKVETYWLKGYSGSQNLTAIICKKLGFRLDYEEKRY